MRRGVLPVLDVRRLLRIGLSYGMEDEPLPSAVAEEISRGRM
eukprot:COSAG02_NODE_6791_length_3359_cov_5.152147_6_plen_41_part_01